MRFARWWIVVVAFLLAYPLAAWIVGGKVHDAIDDEYRQIEAWPLLQVVHRQVDRGIFTSTESLVFEVSLPIEAAPGSAGRPAPLRFAVRTRIWHGPFARATNFAAAVAESELRFENAAAPAATAGNAPAALHARTVYGFDGGASAEVNSAALAFDLPAIAGAPIRMAWDRLAAHVAFPRGLRGYRVSADLPRFEIRDGRGLFVGADDVHIDVEQARVPETDPMPTTGRQRLTARRLKLETGGRAQAAVVFDEFVQSLSMPIHGAFIDLLANVEAATARVGNGDPGPLHCELAWRHLDASALTGQLRSPFAAEQGANIRISLSAVPSCTGASAVCRSLCDAFAGDQEQVH